MTTPKPAKTEAPKSPLTKRERATRWTINVSVKVMERIDAALMQA